MPLAIERRKDTGIVGARGGQKILRIGLILRLQGPKQRRSLNRACQVRISALNLKLQLIKGKRRAGQQPHPDKGTRRSQAVGSLPTGHQGGLSFGYHLRLLQLERAGAIWRYLAKGKCDDRDSVPGAAASVTRL